MSKSVTIKKADFGDDEGNNIPDPRRESGVFSNYGSDPGQERLGSIVVDDEEDVHGMSWSGVPVRLALGFHVLPRLSIEVSGRVDMFIVKNVEPLSCWEAAGEDLDNAEYLSSDNELCNLDMWRDELMDTATDEERQRVAEYSVAQEPGADGRPRTRTVTSTQLAWLINARVRYKAFVSGGFTTSLFGGMGYGHIQYRVPNTTGSDAYYPLPGMVNIELGVGFAYYFNRHIGLIFDVPIDFLVGDGFALNFDFQLGIGVGF